MPSLDVATYSYLIATVTRGLIIVVSLLVLTYRLRALSSGTKMPVVITQLSSINTQVFGLQIQSSLHGTTDASFVFGENLVFMRANHHTPCPF